ncbi:MAG: ABC transporter substrate-binding protein [Actinomycetota bacterium]
MIRSVRWLAVVLVMVLAACAAPQQSSEESTSDSTLVIAVEGEPNNLNPVFGDVFASFNGDHWPIFAGLLDYNKQTELTPALASEMPEISADGLTVTVKLRDGVKWHDGEEFSSEDVVFTYEALLDPAVATSLRDLLFDALEGVEALDKTTVRFTLSRTDPAFLDKLVIGIVPAHILSGQDLNTTAFNINPIGTGPYVFEEFVEGERLSMTANPDYFGGTVGVPRLVFVFMDDENARVAQLEAGQIDIDAVGLTPRIAQRFEDSEAYRIVRIPGEMLSLNLPTHNPLLGDTRTRRAIGLAFDRSAFAQGLFLDFGRPAYSPIQPQHWAYDPSIAYDQNVDEAKSLLSQAGWQPGSDGVLEKSGQRFSLEFLHGTSPLDQNASVTIKDLLASIGIEARLEAVADFSERVERVGETGAITTGRPGNAFDPDLFLRNDFHSEKAVDDSPGSNRNRISEPAIDAAIEKGASSLDRNQRKEAYSELQRALQAQGSAQFLAQRDYLPIVSKKVQGLDPGSIDGHLHGWSRALLWNLTAWQLG